MFCITLFSYQVHLCVCVDVTIQGYGHLCPQLDRCVCMRVCVCTCGVFVNKVNLGIPLDSLVPGAVLQVSGHNSVCL